MLRVSGGPLALQELLKIVFGKPPDSANFGTLQPALPCHLGYSANGNLQIVGSLLNCVGALFAAHVTMPKLNIYS